MKNDSSFWHKKRVLVTGFSGFLGSWLTRALVNYGADVIGFDLITHRRLTILGKKDFAYINVIKGNVEDYSLLSRVIKNNRVEYTFHLAAKALVGECLREPSKSFSTNIKGTWNILEVIRKSQTTKGIIIASSDKAYGSNNDLPYRENQPLLGDHPYDVSKSCADLIAQTYFKTYGVPVSIVRCGNIYGPGDFNFSRIVPDTTRSALRNETLRIRCNGKFTRDYIYVEDVVKGYLTLAQKMIVLNLFGEAFNLSNELPISVLNLVKRIYELVGREPNYTILSKAQHEIKDQYLSAKKAHRVLSWKPIFSLTQGLKNTIEWFKEL